MKLRLPRDREQRGPVGSDNTGRVSDTPWRLRPFPPACIRTRIRI